MAFQYLVTTTPHRRAQRVGMMGALLLLVAARPADSSIQAFHRAYGPKANLLVASPTLQWEVWPSSGARVTSVTMSVNGSSVDAVYNAAKRRVEYQPPAPFPPGDYSVACRVRVEDHLVIKKDWSFQVKNGALRSLPSPDASQDEAIREVSRIREQLNLPPAYQEDRLNAASLAHAKYLSINKRTGHFEKPGEPGFVGATPADRLDAYGYSGGSWECVTYNSGGVRESIRDLFDAPYHRIPFLQLGSVPIGSGLAGRHFSLKFGNGNAFGPSYSPADNQRDVPTSWSANESPNPLRMHLPAPRKVGYPIVFSYFGEENPTLSRVRATLSTKSGDVPIFVSSSENDQRLDNSIFIIPSQPLQPGETYRVSLEATVDGRNQIRKSWSFQTGAK